MANFKQAILAESSRIFISDAKCNMVQPIVSRSVGFLFASVFSIGISDCLVESNFAQEPVICSAPQKRNPSVFDRFVSSEEFSELSHDLAVPRMLEAKAAPGKRVREQLPAYKGTNVYHSLYLPTNYQRGSGKTYPVIFEYAGNGPYQNQLGDRCTGKVEHCSMGYGISAGKDFIWICLPFVSHDGKRNQEKWWGEINASVAYCKAAVSHAVQNYQVDRRHVFLCGFSRGAIACNYIGLHDDEIAKLWCGMICHSHYDGVRNWNYADSDRSSALRRLQRLGKTPQWISQEKSTKETRRFIDEAGVKGNFTYMDLPFANHTDQWLLKKIPQRENLREWVQEILTEKKGTAER